MSELTDTALAHAQALRDAAGEQNAVIDAIAVNGTDTFVALYAFMVRDLAIPYNNSFAVGLDTATSFIALANMHTGDASYMAAISGEHADAITAAANYVVSLE